MKCYEVVENEKQMVILMEWLRGGHLLDTLEEMTGQHYSEQQAAILFVQVRINRTAHQAWTCCDAVHSSRNTPGAKAFTGCMAQQTSMRGPSIVLLISV